MKSNRKKLIKVAGMGLVISFLGSLPLGTMNIAATQVSIAQGTNAGLFYACGSMMVEIAIVRIILAGMNWLVKQYKLFFILEFFTIGLMLALVVGSFKAAYTRQSFSGSFGDNTLSPFILGVLLSISNPLHIPFWFGWSTLLINKKILLPEEKQYNFYVAGIGIGTILGFIVFIYGSNFLIGKITSHQGLLNSSIGTILLITVIIQIRKMSKAPASDRYGKMIKQG